MVEELYAVKQIRKDDEYPYFEVPIEWEFICKNFVNEVDILLTMYNLPLSEVEYSQIKSKFGLRIYYTVLSNYNDDLSECNKLLYSTLDIMISMLRDKTEKYISYLIKIGIIQSDIY